MKITSRFLLLFWALVIVPPAAAYLNHKLGAGTRASALPREHKTQTETDSNHKSAEEQRDREALATAAREEQHEALETATREEQRKQREVLVADIRAQFAQAIAARAIAAGENRVCELAVELENSEQMIRESEIRQTDIARQKAELRKRMRRD